LQKCPKTAGGVPHLFRLDVSAGWKADLSTGAALSHAVPLVYTPASGKKQVTDQAATFPLRLREVSRQAGHASSPRFTVASGDTTRGERSAEIACAVCR
jgi:hypothetical protein